MNLKTAIAAAFTLSTVVTIVACSRSEFGGISGGKIATKDKKDGSESASGSGGTSSNGPQDNLDVEKAAGASKQGGPDIQTLSAEAQCLLKKADFYNFIMIFDASLSTNNSDPSNVRRAGALSFAERFGKLAAIGPKPEFQVVATAFNKTAYAGAHSWVKLGNAASVASLSQDITTLTSDPKLGTRFDTAFALGGTLATARGASGKNLRQRNYFIVMSDGRANGSIDDTDELQALLAPLNQDKGIAVISIAAGSDLHDPGRKKMKALAMPVTGIVAPDHKGLYFEAETDQALLKAWDDLYKLITTCEP